MAAQDTMETQKALSTPSSFTALLGRDRLDCVTSSQNTFQTLWRFDELSTVLWGLKITRFVHSRLFRQLYICGFLSILRTPGCLLVGSFVLTASFLSILGMLQRRRRPPIYSSNCEPFQQSGPKRKLQWVVTHSVLLIALNLPQKIPHDYTLLEDKRLSYQ